MDSTLFERLELLAACLCAELDGGDTMCFCGVIAGETWYDLSGECDTRCGQAWVRVAGIYPATVLGQQDLTLRNCGKVLSLDLEIGAVRCLEVPDDGTPPSAAELLAASEQQMKDALAMRRAVQCCESFDEYILNLWTPIGPPSVALVGGTWTLTVGAN